MRIFAPSACSAGHEATVHELAVDFDRASAAFALAAAFFRAGKAGLLAQHIEQARHGICFEGQRVAVHFARHANLAQRRQACTLSSISRSTSGVMGMRVMSAPVACAMALAIAGAVPSSGSSPIPFAPAGPRA